MARTNKPTDERYGILFVDDEEMAQKYFRKACEEDFPVFTASNVDDAVKLLDEKSDTIGVLVTDQRMPGKSGTDLLQHANTRYPEIVRILTTAYSDLDSAIEAVNTGAIFHYVTKPWNVRALRGLLLRAMDHFELQRERDALLCEKLSVLQRMIMLDRARVLCVLGAALEGRLRFPLHAVRDYLAFVMAIAENAPDPLVAGWEEMWVSNVTESQCALDVARAVLDATAPGTFEKVPADALRPAAGLSFESSVTDSLVADPRMLSQLTGRLAQLAAELWEGQPAKLAAARDGGQVTLTLSSGGASDGAVAKLLPIVKHNSLEPRGAWLDLLVCHLLANHHGGSVSVSPTDVSKLVVKLPVDASAGTKPALAAEWIEDLMVAYEV